VKLVNTANSKFVFLNYRFESDSKYNLKKNQFMQKKTLLKKTREYLQSNFPENLLPEKKIRQKKKKLFFYRAKNLTKQIIKAKKKLFNEYSIIAKKLFSNNPMVPAKQTPWLKNEVSATSKVETSDYSFVDSTALNLAKAKTSFSCSSNNQKAKQIQYLPAFSKQIKFLNLKKLEFYSAFILQKNKQTDSSTLGLWTAKQLSAKASQPSFFKQRQSTFNHKNYFDINKLIPSFLFSASQIKYELFKKQARFSDFKNQLKERKKLSIIYGKFSKKYIKKTLIQASKLHGKLNDNFLFLLEARLDVVLFRASFFSSIPSARQWISHNKILVNNNIINTASYILKPGDIISISPQNKTNLSKKILQKINLHSSLQTNNADKQKLSQTKSTNKFLVSNLLFLKLKKFLKNSVNSKFIINYLKKNSSTASAKQKNEVFLEAAKKTEFLKVEQKENLLNYKKFIFQLKQIMRSLLDRNLQFKTQNLKFINIIRSNFNNQKLKQNLFNNVYPLQGSKNISTKLVNFENLANNEVINLSEAEKKFLLFNLIQLEFLEKKNLKTLEGLRYFLIFLKLKKLFFNNKFKKQNFSIVNVNILKPLNLEISYKNLLIIYLYSPQKLTFPCNLDIELINQSFS